MKGVVLASFAGAIVVSAFQWAAFLHPVLDTGGVRAVAAPVTDDVSERDLRGIAVTTDRQSIFKY
jgi:hypothetical protein